MPVHRKFSGQIIAGTRMDGHGERRSKEFFEHLIASFPPRTPLHQQHDMAAETLGYMENFRLVPDKNEPDEWNVIADVYLTSDNIDEALRGFSYSALETIGGNVESPLYYVYLPYPTYNDAAFISELISEESELLAGRWIKKALDQSTLIGLIATGVALSLSPEWDIQYKENIRPAIKRLLSFVPRLKEKGVSPDLIQCAVGHHGEAIQVYFIPDRSDEIGSFSDEHLLAGLNTVKVFLNIDNKSKSVGVARIKLYFDKLRYRYVLFHVQYLDGTDEHHA